MLDIGDGVGSLRADGAAGGCIVNLGSCMVGEAVEMGEEIMRLRA
jgi:hypothetical protein